MSKVNFTECVESITINIINEVVELIDENYNNHNQSFYMWITECSDTDFTYVYESQFKLYFLPYITTDTERILSYFSFNLSCAISAFYNIDTNIIHLKLFLNHFIKNQFKSIDQYQLFMEEM